VAKTFSVVSSKRQITLPIKVMKEVGIKEGDKVKIVAVGNEIRISKIPESYAEKFSGILSEDNNDKALGM
jgi:AbrB family looped-hinge helix DNA binding protein